MEYNPFLPEVRDNPYPYYAYLREHAPVYQVPDFGWMISRYDDVLSVLRNPRVFSSVNLLGSMGDLNPFPPAAPPLSGSDPPDHTRLRKLANRAFTPRRIASLETRLREIIRQLLDPIAGQGTFDLVSGVAVPLPIIAVAELLGVTPERYADFKRWANNFLKAMNPFALSPEDEVEVRRSQAEFVAYLQAAIETCRVRPRDNLLSDLVRAEEEEQRLTREEVLSLALLILLGGAETTTNLIGNMMLALLEHPEQMAQVRANPALIPNVVEETLRYDTAVQMMPRQTTQAVDIAGTSLPAGAKIFYLIASANRDEQHFPNPDRFDIHRNTEGHLGFGFGIHFCLGALLARLETKLVLEIVLKQFPHVARTDEPFTRVDFPWFRGLKTLPLGVG